VLTSFILLLSRISIAAKIMSVPIRKDLTKIVVCIDRNPRQAGQGEFTAQWHTKIRAIVTLTAPLCDRYFWLVHLPADVTGDEYIVKDIIKFSLNQSDTKTSALVRDHYANQQAKAILAELAG
jgi:hypothetical protein